MTEESVTGMEHAIEKVARAIYGAMHRDTDPYSVPLERAAEKAARRLAAEGLLAPAPLTEEWWAYGLRGGGRYRASTQAQAALMAHEFSMDPTPGGFDADWTVQHRYVSAWLPVDRAEGDGRAEP